MIIKNINTITSANTQLTSGCSKFLHILHVVFQVVLVRYGCYRVGVTAFVAGRPATGKTTTDVIQNEEESIGVFECEKVDSRC